MKILESSTTQLINTITKFAQLSSPSVELLTAIVDQKQDAKCHIDAKNDIEAVHCWLAEYQGKPTTHRSYQKEAERLLLWCVVEKRKLLAQLTRDDFEDYFRFLRDPAPKELWCAPRGSKSRRRGGQGWKPFVGPLSPSAQKTAITIINSLMSYLAQAQYIDFNPLSLIRRKAKHASNLAVQRLSVVERILEDDEWQAMLQTLDSLPEATSNEKDEKERLRFLVAILFLLGLPIHELQSHTWNAFRKVQGDWWFFVLGKGDKPAKIPVNNDLVEAMTRFRNHLKMEPLPSPEDDRPLIPSWRQQKSLGTRQMSQLLKNLAEQTAKKFADQPEKVKKLKRFSPHWLRHLSASTQDRVGISFKHIKGNLRHESDDTTRKYVHAIDKERHEDMNKLTFGVNHTTG